MGMGLAGAFGAGAGGDALQDMLKQRFAEQIQRQAMAQQAKRDAIEADDHAMRRQQHEAQMNAPQAGERPMTISAGQQIVDPTTGKVIFAAPTAAPAAVRPVAVGGRLVDPTTGKVIYEAPPEAPAPQRPVSVAPGGRLVDPTTGKVVFAAPDRPAGPAEPKTMPPAIQSKVAELDASLNSLDKLEGSLAGVSQYMGPVAGRMAQFTQGMPGSKVDPVFAAFSAETATLKNQTIKAITGAGMSQAEAERIMQQIPDVTDKPEVWKAKAAATRQNQQYLRNRTVELAGGNSGPAAPHGPAASHSTAAAPAHAPAAAGTSGTDFRKKYEY